MSKYTNLELQRMARETLIAKDNNDPRYKELMMFLSAFTGQPITRCLLNITHMADGNFDEVRG